MTAWPDAVPVTEGREATRSFEAFFLEERSTVIGIAYSVLRDHAVAEELAQDVFARVYLRYDRLADPRRYALRSISNACKNELRRRTHKLNTVAEAAHQPDYLADAISKLSTNQRIAVTLRFYADLPYAEIAAALRCRESTARTTLSRALDELRKQIHN